MLRIAVPNKGVLSEPAAEMLAESGYRQRRSTKDLAVYDPDNDTEFFYLRPRDIAVYVAAGTLDVGITGRDMLLETAPLDGEGPAAVEVMPLGFGRSSFRFASPVASGTVHAVRDGVHAAGKKVVEEAAESWMAAEHEGPERTAEEISQLLYRVQVLMLTRGLSLDDVYAHL